VSVKIRLKKIGRKKQPTFRIVITESQNARSGKVIENVGRYTPYLKNKPLDLELDRVEYWVGKGAIVTDAVKKLIRRKRHGDILPVKESKSKAAAAKPVEISAQPEGIPGLAENPEPLIPAGESDTTAQP